MRPGGLALRCVHVSWGEEVVRADCLLWKTTRVRTDLGFFAFVLSYRQCPLLLGVFTQLSHPQNPALWGQTGKGSWARLPPAHRHPRGSAPHGGPVQGSSSPTAAVPARTGHVARTAETLAESHVLPAWPKCHDHPCIPTARCQLTPEFHQ